METLFIAGAIAGVFIGIAISNYLNKNRNKHLLKDQSALLVNRIKRVCKLITVEGEFSELLSHRDGKNLFFKLMQIEKKALVIVKAKVMVGFDLTRIRLETNNAQKTIKLSNFPEPEILSIDSDVEYYDIQKGIVNKFSETDLTNLNKKAKEIIREKVGASHLITLARSQARDNILLIQQLVETAGWKLDMKEVEALMEANVGKLESKI